MEVTELAFFLSYKRLSEALKAKLSVSITQKESLQATPDIYGQPESTASGSEPKGNTQIC